ncbi:SDR family NAD(P)-dependent oxidoreductase [Sphingobacterium sp. SYP-B4668]|uniref:SDR family NAD(P)-dependent oxidoreductase n=1 Tax=Sphingobacterium sp. SYP-B4668 TaxID=2996035 RepID=UPI0022DE9256|nr:SDR family oxidoreductase [Sphingobacterium sp. SYP-B4668]
MENLTLDLFSLKGQVVLITGGTGLFGKPMSRALAESGAIVVIASRDFKACQQYAESLVAEGWQACAYPLDLLDESSIASLVDQLLGQFGRIDVLINNAVSREGFKTLSEITKEEWEGAQRINSTGMMLLTQRVLRDMVTRQRGNIINIGSIQSVVGPHFPVYGDTGLTSPINYTYDKWGMVGFTKWIANYYGQFGIRCNCLSPGGYGPGIETNIGENAFTANYKKLTPLQRFANDADIKGPVVFLASPASAYMTGHNLVVDGGWTSW